MHDGIFPCLLSLSFFISWAQGAFGQPPQAEGGILGAVLSGARTGLWWSLWVPPNSGYSMILYFRYFHSLALCSSAVSVGHFHLLHVHVFLQTSDQKNVLWTQVTRTGALEAPALHRVIAPMTWEIWQTTCLLFLSSQVRDYLDSNNSKPGNTIALLFISVRQTTGTNMMVWKTSQKTFIQQSLLLIVIKQQLIILHSENFMTAVIWSVSLLTNQAVYLIKYFWLFGFNNSN